jgi:hypothetical protein
VLYINCINLLCPSLSESALMFHRAPRRPRSSVMHGTSSAQNQQHHKEFVSLTAVACSRPLLNVSLDSVTLDDFDSKSRCVSFDVI